MKCHVCFLSAPMPCKKPHLTRLTRYLLVFVNNGFKLNYFCSYGVIRIANGIRVLPKLTVNRPLHLCEGEQFCCDSFDDGVNLSETWEDSTDNVHEKYMKGVYIADVDKVYNWAQYETSISESRGGEPPLYSHRPLISAIIHETLAFVEWSMSRLPTKK